MALKLGSGNRSGGGQTFVLCPAGMQQAVCCDVVDHGLVDVPVWNKPGQKKKSHKVSLRWQSQHVMADGKPYLVARRFTLSSHQKATLRQFLATWRGRPMSDTEAADFDLERLIGVNAMLVVTHEDKRNGRFAEVMMAAPVPRNIPRLQVRDYVRLKDRPPEEAQPATAAAAASGADPTGAQEPYPSEWDAVDPDPGEDGAVRSADESDDLEF